VIVNASERLNSIKHLIEINNKEEATKWYKQLKQDPGL